MHACICTAQLQMHGVVHVQRPGRRVAGCGHDLVVDTIELQMHVGVLRTAAIDACEYGVGVVPTATNVTWEDVENWLLV